MVKRANGYGSIIKAKDGRKKLYRVKVTIAYYIDETTGKKKQKQKILGSFRTNKEAIKALDEYNATKYTLDTKDITFAEVYEEVKKNKLCFNSKSSINGYAAAFNNCKDLHNMKILDIKHKHLQNIINKCDKSYASKRKLLSLFKIIFKYADQNDMVKKNYANYVDISKHKPITIEKTRLSDDTITQLNEQAKNKDHIQLICILIYSGVRISELLQLKKSDVNLNDKYFTVVKSKNKNGLRNVPIADKIMPFVEYWYNKSDSEYIFTSPTGKNMNYNYFRKHYWDPIFKDFDETFTPHVTRHTTISLLAMAGVDERIAKRIVGHSRSGVTDSVYTHYDDSFLHEAINKI